MFINIIPNIYMKVTGESGLIANVPPWHTIYVGYGFEENPYGIEYSDSCGIDFAASVDPDAAYLSPEYFDILRNEIFRMWKSNPTYFVGSYLRKIVMCLKTAAFWGIYSIVIGIVGSIYVIRKGDRKKLSAVAAASLLSFLMNMIFPLMAVPRYAYELGMLCSLNFYGLWVMACVITILFAEKLGYEKGNS